MSNDDSRELAPPTHKSAGKFLDELRPNNWLDKHDNWETAWEFRGQGDVLWELKPSAWRWHKDEAPKTEADKIIIASHKRNMEMVDGLIKEWSEIKGFETRNDHRGRNLSLLIHQAFAEHDLIVQFRRMFNELGLDFGEYYSEGKNAHNFVGEYFEALLAGKPYTSRFWVGTSVVLAQHHGIPTRMLDWTSNPLVAAFFAAESGFENKTEQIAVVAQNRFRRGSVRAPNTSSDYLHAQSGLFTIDPRAECHFMETGVFPTFSNSHSEISVPN